MNLPTNKNVSKTFIFTLILLVCLYIFDVVGIYVHLCIYVYLLLDGHEKKLLHNGMCDHVKDSDRKTLLWMVIICDETKHTGPICSALGCIAQEMVPSLHIHFKGLTFLKFKPSYIHSKSVVR